NGVTSTYVYDPLQRVLSITHANGAASLSHQVYTYDPAGNRITQLSDALQPLTTQAAVSTFNLNNSLVSRAAITYLYDANVNRLQETGPAGTTSYMWDGRNRLQSITDPAGRLTRFRYDFGRNLIEIAKPNGLTQQF